MVSLWKFFAVSSLILLSLSTAGAKELTFKSEKIKLSGKILTVEIAQTMPEHEQGLMFRKSLPENGGMLFIFNNEDVRYFWMKNTIIDLSIGYFDQNKSLIDIQEMKATSVMEARPPSYPSAKPAMYALEMNKGWFTKNKVKIGQKFQFLSR